MKSSRSIIGMLVLLFVFCFSLKSFTQETDNDIHLFLVEVSAMPADNTTSGPIWIDVRFSPRGQHISYDVRVHIRKYPGPDPDIWQHGVRVTRYLYAVLPQPLPPAIFYDQNRLPAKLRYLTETDVDKISDPNLLLEIVRNQSIFMDVQERAVANPNFPDKDLIQIIMNPNDLHLMYAGLRNPKLNQTALNVWLEVWSAYATDEGQIPMAATALESYSGFPFGKPRPVQDVVVDAMLGMGNEPNQYCVMAVSKYLMAIHR